MRRRLFSASTKPRFFAASPPCPGFNPPARISHFPQAATAQDLGLTERGWRKIIKGAVEPLAATAERIQELAEQRRIEEP
jgi:hypothetical protein